MTGIFDLLGTITGGGIHVEAGGTLTALYDEPAPASPGATGRFTLTATIPATKPETATDQEVPR